MKQRQRLTRLLPPLLLIFLPALRLLRPPAGYPPDLKPRRLRRARYKLRDRQQRAFRKNRRRRGRF